MFKDQAFDPAGVRLASITSEFKGRMPRFVTSEEEGLSNKVILVIGRLEARMSGTLLLSPPTTLVEPIERLKSLSVSRTMTLKYWVALKDGVPLSVTTSVKTFVLGPWVEL